MSSAERSSAPPVQVSLFILALTAAAIGLALLSPEYRDLDPHWSVLGGFVGLLVGAEWLSVRFRYRGEVNALNLVEAVLTPLIASFPVAAVIAAIALAQLLTGALRRNSPVKVAFNAAQWAVAAGVGTALLALTGTDPSFGVPNLAMVVAALFVVGVVNQTCFTTVVSLADDVPMRRVLTDLAPVIPGWAIGWTLNTLVGLLFLLAYETSSAAIVLFPVPLGVLHAAYRGYAGARSDRQRLAGVHQAARVLAGPFDPNEALAPFLAEVCRCFEAPAAELLVPDGNRLVIHHVDASAPEEERRSAVAWHDRNNLHVGLVALAASGGAHRVLRTDDSPLASKLAEAGWRDCLVAPLTAAAVPGVAIAVFDQAGLEGFEEGERAVLEALGREAGAIFEKGSLLSAILDQRRKVEEIVTTASDVIVTIDARGKLLSANPAFERLAGITEAAAAGKTITEIAEVWSGNGAPVALERWTTELNTLPEELKIIDAGGEMHWLSCSYTPTTSDNDEGRVLIVIGRDTSKAREAARLRKDVDRLAELEATQRARVLELQESLQPAIPAVPDTTFGVHYIPADENAPAGGDFYDWQVLPTGDVHVAVVDVLGSGISATKDALTVIHTLRMLAIDRVPLDELARRADVLLQSDASGVVASAIVAHYSPADGRLRLAGAGHPPPLVLRADGSVREIPAPGIPLGWPGAGSDAVVELMLGADETLVLYTDGVVETDKDIVAGLATLASNAARLRELEAAEMARALLERSLSTGGRRDDSLVLVLRRVLGVKAPAPSEHDAFERF